MPEPQSATTRRHSFRYGLRALLACVLDLLESPVAGWRQRYSKRGGNTRQLRPSKSAGGMVLYDYQEAKLTDDPFAATEPPMPGWKCLRAVVGDDVFRHVTYVRLDGLTLNDSMVAQPQGSAEAAPAGHSWDTVAEQPSHSTFFPMLKLYETDVSEREYLNELIGQVQRQLNVDNRTGQGNPVDFHSSPP